MADRIRTWNEDDMLKTGIVVESFSGIGGGQDLSFDLALLFPGFLKFDLAQKWAVFNGVKQRLLDKTTFSQNIKMTTTEQRTWQVEQWKRMTVERIWRKATVPATPLSRAKATVTAIETQIADFTKQAKTAKMDKTMLATMLKTMYSPQLVKAQAALKTALAE